MAETSRKERRAGVVRRIKLPAAQRHVFVAGCPRTGTSALALLLNEHPSVAIGFERFKRVRDIVEPFHFEPGVLCNPVPTETDIFVPGFYEHLAGKLEHGGIAVVGDKVPLYTDALEHLQATFPACRIVMTVRELEATAASFRQRATDPSDVWSEANDHLAAAYFWNGALYSAREFESAGHGGQLLLIPYDEMFDGQRLWLEMLLDFLELPSTAAFTRAYEDSVVAARARAQAVDRELPRGTRDAILAERDEELDAWWRERIEEQTKNFRGRLRASSDQPAIEPGPGVPIPAEVRSELLQALKAAPKPQDELSGLERRIGAQMRELAKRRRMIAQLEQEFGSVSEELALATRARQALSTELQELTAQSGATRERLAARTAELEAEVESARAAGVPAPGTPGPELAEALAQADRERERLASELRSRDADQAELERRLAARGEELDATVRQLTSIERTVLALRDAIAEHTSEVEAIRAERASLVERVDALMLHNDGLTRALTGRERAENELRIRVGELQAAAARAEVLERERRQTLEDVRRAEASRAWRLGHGVTRLLRRITFRRSRTGGALERVIERLEAPLPEQTEAPESEPR